MFRQKFLFFGLFLLILAACQAPPRASGPVEFTILQMNDVYEIAPLEGGKAGGLARVAAVKRQLMRENPNTIAVLSGDFLSPSFIGTLKDDDGKRIAGRQMVETLNALELDYATFGNHEFDLGSADLLQERINQSDFRYVCCNAYRREGDMMAPFSQRIGGVDQSIPPYVVHEFSDGRGATVKVALIGVVLPFNRASYVGYQAVTPAFREAYEAARPEADVVLALTHLTEEQDKELAREVPGVTLFMGGHDHNNMSHYIERTIIAKADANAKTIYIHRFTFDPVSEMVDVRSTLQKIDDSLPEEPATKAVVDSWQDRVFDIMNQEGYQPDRFLMTAGVPLVCTEALIRTQPTNYGELTTRAFEAVWPDADAYLVNSGSMRLDDNISGAVTEYDVLRTFPFGGRIVRMELPGDALEEVLRIGLTDNKGEGGYLQLWQASYAADQCLIKGRPLDRQGRYQVVMPEFLAQGKEANLELLGAYNYASPETFQVNEKTIRNDVRDIVIHFMGGNKE